MHTQFPTTTLFPDVGFVARSFPAPERRQETSGLGALFYPLSNANSKTIAKRLADKTIYLGVKEGNCEAQNAMEINSYGHVELDLFKQSGSIKEGGLYI
jgi:hypothetical protein